MFSQTIVILSYSMGMGSNGLLFWTGLLLRVLASHRCQSWGLVL